MCTIVHELIKPLMEKLTLTNYKVKITSGSEKGDGYLGEITTVKVCGLDKLNESKELNFVVKTASVGEEQRKFMPIKKIYQREAYMYNVIFPQFQKFQAEKSVTNPFKSVAKCYTTSLKDEAEALVFNNLRSEGYDTCNRQIPMNEDHLVMGLKEYGKFHALSFALRDQEPENFEKLTSCIDDVFAEFVIQSNFECMFKVANRNLREKLEKAGYGNLGDRLKILDEEINDILIEYCKKETNNFVILHGDCHSNNMMFKYEKDPNRLVPSAICFLDWQLSRLGPQVLDLSYYFYACASKSALDNLNKYLKIYYDSFATLLKELGSNPEKLFSFDDFMAQWKKYCKYGLTFTIVVLRLMLADKDDVPNTTSDEMLGAFSTSFKNERAYIQRCKDIVENFVNNDLI